MCFKLPLYYRKGIKPVRYIAEQREHKYIDRPLGRWMKVEENVGKKVCRQNCVILKVALAALKNGFLHSFQCNEL